MHDLSRLTYLARTNARQSCQLFGIKQRDRLFHLYVIGKTGTGKSTFLEMLAPQDIWSGRGLVLIDRTAISRQDSREQIPEHRRSELIYLNAPDLSQPYGYNPLRRVHRDRIPLAVSGVLEALKKIWNHEWGVRTEHVLRNALYALLEYGDAMNDLMNLANYDLYLKLMIDGTPSKPFSATTLHPGDLRAA